MKSLKLVLFNNRILFTGLAILVLAGILIDGGGVIPLSANHPVWLNVFFINYTFMGDGFFALALAAFFYLYLKDKRMGLMLLSAFVLTESVVQMIKNLADNGPATLFFEAGQYLFFNEEQAMFNYHSSLSGHTAIAFAIYCVLVQRMKTRSGRILLFLAAALLGFSRLYLAQDALWQVAAGALIGSTSGLLVIWAAGYAGNFQQFIRDVFSLHKIKSGSQKSIQPA